MIIDDLVSVLATCDYSIINEFCMQKLIKMDQKLYGLCYNGYDTQLRSTVASLRFIASAIGVTIKATFQPIGNRYEDADIIL